MLQAIPQLFKPIVILYYQTRWKLERAARRRLAYDRGYGDEYEYYRTLYNLGDSEDYVWFGHNLLVAKVSVGVRYHGFFFLSNNGISLGRATCFSEPCPRVSGVLIILFRSPTSLPPKNNVEMLSYNRHVLFFSGSCLRAVLVKRHLSGHSFNLKFNFQIFFKLFQFCERQKLCQTTKTLSNPAAELLNRVCSCF